MLRLVRLPLFELQAKSILSVKLLRRFRFWSYHLGPGSLPLSVQDRVSLCLLLLLLLLLVGASASVSLSLLLASCCFKRFFFSFINSTVLYKE